MKRTQRAGGDAGRTRGRRWLRPALGLAALLAGALLAWPQDADAQDAAVAVQKGRAAHEAGHHRKAAALERLCRMESSAARNALLELADVGDDRTAVAALGALCREDFRGARGKLEDVFEDDERSDLVRSTAIGAVLDRRHADGDSWSDVRGYVTTHTDTDDAVREMAWAVATHLWGSEVSRD